MNIELNVMSTMITRKRWRRCLEYDDDHHHHRDSEYEDDNDAEAGSGREVGKEQKTLAITFHLRCSTQQGQVWYFCILVFCILFLYSPIFIFVCHLGNTSCKKRMFSLPELPLPGRGLPPIFSDNGQKNFFFDQNEPFWGEKQLNVPAGIDGPTWCERCGRKRRKSKRIIQFNRYLGLLPHNGKKTQKNYPAGCLASGRLDLKQRISLKSRNPWISLKLKSHIFYYQVNPVT